MVLKSLNFGGGNKDDWTKERRQKISFHAERLKRLLDNMQSPRIDPSFLRMTIAFILVPFVFTPFFKNPLSAAAEERVVGRSDDRVSKLYYKF